MDHYSWQNRLLLKQDSSLMIKTIEGVCLTTGSPNQRSPKRALPQTSAPPNEHKKNALENGRFRTQNVNKIGQKKNCD